MYTDQPELLIKYGAGCPIAISRISALHACTRPSTGPDVRRHDDGAVAVSRMAVNS